MSSKAERKALFRSKVREASQKRDKRIDSPLVRYNEYEQPVCRVCNVVLKSEALWPAHQASRKHHEAIENVKAAAAAGVSQDSKTSKDQQVEVHKPRSSSVLPEGFFDNQEAKRQKSGNDAAVAKLPAGSSSSDLPHKRNEVPHSSGHTVEVPLSSKKATVVANDHLVEKEERSEKKGFTKLDQPSKKDYSDGKQIKGALPEGFFDNKERNDSQTVSQLSEGPSNVNHLEIGQGGPPKDLESTQAKGALPEGFFDNKDADLRARGIKPVKVDINDAYKEFEKEIQDDLQEVDARLEEEEIDAAYVREEFESLEQKAYREKVDMVKKQLVEFKAARLARGQKSPAFKGKESSDDSSSDEDDESFAVDWRAKHL